MHIPSSLALSRFTRQRPSEGPSHGPHVLQDRAVFRCRFHLMSETSGGLEVHSGPAIPKSESSDGLTQEKNNPARKKMCWDNLISPSTAGPKPVSVGDSNASHHAPSACVCVCVSVLALACQKRALHTTHDEDEAVEESPAPTGRPLCCGPAAAAEFM